MDGVNVLVARVFGDCDGLVVESEVVAVDPPQPSLRIGREQAFCRETDWRLVNVLRRRNDRPPPAPPKEG